MISGRRTLLQALDGPGHRMAQGPYGRYGKTHAVRQLITVVGQASAETPAIVYYAWNC